MIEVFPLCALLLLAGEARLHENRAPFGKMDRTFRGKGYFLEFPDDIDLHLVSQFVQKTARPGRAYLVHVEIKGVGVF